MISTKALKYQYDLAHTFVFPDIKCEAMETLLVTGNSGVGKTTLLHLLAGIIRPISGEILINNQNINDLSKRALDKFRGNNIGLILQQAHFVEALTVIENLELASWLAKGSKNTAKALVLLNELEISEHKNKMTYELSVGQQQRLSIARALMANPKVLLADEPTSNLDDGNTALVSNLLVQLASIHEVALVVVTHDYRLKNSFANHVNLTSYVV